VVAAVLRELGHAEPLPRTEPELMADPEIRRRFLGGCSRTKYWQLTKQPGFPVAVQIGKTNYRRVDEVRRWLAEREVS
jgi:hypothetical protein